MSPNEKEDRIKHLEAEIKHSQYMVLRKKLDPDSDKNHSLWIHELVLAAYRTQLRELKP